MKRDTPTPSGVSCYEKDGTAYLNLEAVARGLGFTDKKGDVEYVRWNRVDGYLKELNFATRGERPSYIPENIFYRLAMKAKNETAEKFQALVADEIIPSIRKNGYELLGKTRVSENQDFVVTDIFVHHSQGGSQSRRDAAITIDMAKEICNFLCKVRFQPEVFCSSLRFNSKFPQAYTQKS